MKIRLTICILWCCSVFYAQDWRVFQDSSTANYGFRDSLGTVRLAARWDTLAAFSESLAIYGVRQPDSTFLYGYLNPQGEVQVAAAYTHAGDFREGMALVIDPESEKCGYINPQGEVVLPFAYPRAGWFSEGLAAASDDSDNIGYINHRGEFVIQPNSRWKDAAIFKGGFAAVQNYLDQWGFINRKGELIRERFFDSYDHFSGGFAAVMKGDKWGYIDSTGNEVFGFYFDEAGPFIDGKAETVLRGQPFVLENTPEMRQRFVYREPPPDESEIEWTSGQILGGLLGLLFLVITNFYLIYLVVRWLGRKGLKITRVIHYAIKRSRFTQIRNLVKQNQAPAKRFKPFYENELMPVLQEIEKKRRRRLRHYVIYLLIGLGTLIILYWINQIAGAIATIFYVISIWAYLQVIEAMVHTDIYADALVKIISFVDEDLEFRSDEGLTQGQVAGCFLLKQTVDNYYFGSKKLIQARKQPNKFKLAEVDATTGKDQEGMDYAGMLFVAEIGEHAAARTFCRSDGKEFPEEKTFQRITLESDEFNALFHTFSTDQIGARVVLTPAAMEKIIELRTRLDDSIFITFEGKRLYVGMPDFTEIHVLESVLNYPYFERYFNMLDLLRDITRELYLD